MCTFCIGARKHTDVALLYAQEEADDDDDDEEEHDADVEGDEDEEEEDDDEDEEDEEEEEEKGRGGGSKAAEPPKKKHKVPDTYSRHCKLILGCFSACEDAVGGGPQTSGRPSQYARDSRDRQGPARFTDIICHVQASSQKATPRKGGDDEVLYALCSA